MAAGTDTRPRLRSRDAVRGYVERVCFKTGPPGLVGAELEWLVVCRDDPSATVPIPRLRHVLEDAGPPPQGSRITFEPGGQVELSSLPYRGPSACWRALHTDAEHVRAALGAADLRLLSTALDPCRRPHRQLAHPRYEAMARHFARAGGRDAELGPVMMTGTAAVQVNLDVGADLADTRRRWGLLHTIGPTMVAAFANSPVSAGLDTGWRSGRQRVWQGLDPRRTAAPTGGDPVTAWTDFALDAPVMLHRRDDTDWSPAEDRTLRTWLEDPDGPGEPDLELHLSTLFPPVRPRGWLEVRYLDAQPWRWWPVPVAVLTALVDDAAAAAEAELACAGVTDWGAAGRDALAAPALHDAAIACFDVAVQALTRRAEHPALIALVRSFRDQYVYPGHCPADDPLEV